jgi:FkbM family methyltransferase
MRRLSHFIWFVRWLQRLGSAVLRRRKVIDLLPSLLVPQRRVFFDRRVGRLRSIKLRKQLSDYWAYDQCLALTGLDLDLFPQGRLLRERYEEMLAEGRTPVILDCGANIGVSSYWLGVEFPRAIVIAVEPDVENMCLAERNTRLCNNVRNVLGAVASVDCRLSLTNTNQGSDAIRTVPDEDGEVRGHSVASLLAMVGGSLGDLLLAKIDIEGFESELFSSNTEWVDETGAIIVETHDWMLPGQATATNLLRALSRKRRDFLVDGEHVLSFRL